MKHLKKREEILLESTPAEIDSRKGNGQSDVTIKKYGANHKKFANQMVLYFHSIKAKTFGKNLAKKATKSGTPTVHTDGSFMLAIPPTQYDNLTKAFKSHNVSYTTYIYK